MKTPHRALDQRHAPTKISPMRALLRSPRASMKQAAFASVMACNSRRLVRTARSLVNTIHPFVPTARSHVTSGVSCGK